MKDCYVLGISAFYHDSACALLKNGKLVAAVQEERFTRIKHDLSFPVNSINFLLSHEGIKLKDIDHVVFYEKPFLKFTRIVKTVFSFAPKGFDNFYNIMQSWLLGKLFTNKKIIKELNKIDSNLKIKKINYIGHHLSHAASAFYPSPFQESAILTIDGVGEWSTTSLSVGEGSKINILEEIKFPHSIGLFYSTFTSYLGFKVNSGEYKIMGLAPYGRPVFKNLILEKLIDLKDDGSFRLNLDFFDYTHSNKMFNNKLEKLFNTKKRKQEGTIEQVHKDIAASIQSAVETIILKIAKYCREKTKKNRLCLAGGVALNCVANGKLLKEKYFEKIWIQPAAGDAGGALGAAYEFWYSNLKNVRISDDKNDSMQGSFLGPSFNNDAVFKKLSKLGADFDRLDDEKLISKVAEKISEQNCIGWFQGRMEFGPRALGSRSILADPRSETMQSTLNLKIKFREGFRPFAPCILSDDLQNWFDLDIQSDYMMFVAEILDKHKLDSKKSTIPAVTHVDFSARVQTVNEKNEKLHKLLKKFKQITNCPILVNTSFNLRGEPMVCSIEDAYRTFMISNLDFLVCENYFLDKKKQKNRTRYTGSYKAALD
jgi:carbamoyltransferase